MSTEGIGNEFMAGTVRGMGMAAGGAWYSSTWLYVVVIIIVVYYFHTNPPQHIMMALTGKSTGWDQFTGKWYASKHTIKLSSDAKTFTRDGKDVDIEDGHIYALAGLPKVRFDAELTDGVLSHVFIIHKGKSLAVSIDGGKPIVYWKDKRKAAAQKS